MCRERQVVLAAALAGGLGRRTQPELADLLMQTAPEDMFEEAQRQLLAPDQQSAEETARLGRLLEQTIHDFRAPLDPSCYLSPTQFAETFELKAPAPQVENTAAADTPSEKLVSRVSFDGAHFMFLGDHELQDAEWVERHHGNSVYRLSDGRYFVLYNVVLPNIEQARLAAAAIRPDDQ